MLLFTTQLISFSIFLLLGRTPQNALRGRLAKIIENQASKTFEIHLIIIWIYSDFFLKLQDIWANPK
jgi:hypothetical protein